MTDPRPAPIGLRSKKLYQLRREPVVGCRAKYLAVKPQDDSTLSAAQPRRVLHEGFEHWLEVERRAADHLEHLAGRRLLLQRLGQLAVPRLRAP